jgi:hypothetical protein
MRLQPEISFSLPFGLPTWTYIPDPECVPPEEAVPKKDERLPPILLTSAANFIQLQKQIKSVAKQSFEFRCTRNGTGVIARDMVGCLKVKIHLDTNNLV